MDLMSFWEHLEELRSRIIKIAVTLGAIGAITFFFGLRPMNIGGFTLYYPFTDMYNNINTIVFNRIRNDFLGAGHIELIQVGVADAMIIQMEITLFLAISIGMPMIVYQINKFLSPGLFVRERRFLVKISIPATILFIMGVVFAYVLIIPFTFKFLYGYTIAMGVAPTLSMEAFMSFVILFLLAFGIVFEMPIIQYSLTKLGVVKPEFWINNWKYAFVGMILFGAVITPDGSGITQLMIAFPMLGLYFFGYIISNYAYKKQNANKKDKPA